MVCLEKATDVGAAVTFYMVSCLSDIDAIEAVSEAEIGEWIRGFDGKTQFATDAGINVLGNGLIGAGKNEIVNLAAQKIFKSL